MEPSAGRAGPPPADVAIPRPVRRLGGGAALRPVWRNQLGGLTFALGDPPDRYVKWAPAGADPAPIDLSAEAGRLQWAGRHAPVPEVLDHGTAPDGSWLVTRALPGESAVAPRWLSEPETAVRAIGEGLRALHDELPVAGCPFDWSPARRLAQLRPEFGHRRDELVQAPTVDRLVVCHGDACAPNTIVGVDGRWVGHVDLGALGAADRWADLAVASMSLGWNYGDGWEAAFFDAYGVEPDDARLAHHRLLWNCT